MAEFHKFSEKDVEALFKEFDSNHDQVIDHHEFEALLKKVLGRAASKDEADKIFKQVDTNNDGKISYGELKDAFQKK